MSRFFKVAVFWTVFLALYGITSKCFIRTPSFHRHQIGRRSIYRPPHLFPWNNKCFMASSDEESQQNRVNIGVSRPRIDKEEGDQAEGASTDPQTNGDGNNKDVPRGGAWNVPNGNGVIFSDDFRQGRRKRGKLVSSRDRRRDRMINARSQFDPTLDANANKPDCGNAAVGVSLLKAVPGSSESVVRGSKLRSGLREGNSDDARGKERQDRSRSANSSASTRTTESSMGSVQSVPPVRGNSSRQQQPPQARRVRADQQAHANANTNAGGTDNEPFLSKASERGGGQGRGASSSAINNNNNRYSISGKQTTLHANDVYCRFLHYDHLATHSLAAIEVSSSRIPRHKNLAYISRWWYGAQKWGVLSPELRDLGARFGEGGGDSEDQPQQPSDDSVVAEKGYHASAPPSASFTDPEHVDGGTTNEFTPRRISKEMHEAIRDHCGHYKARVICVGDVHGCADELGDLLRKVHYRPCDVVVLLGDLVAKGPRSSDVINMAIDLNAMSVRGNHDQEVIRRSVTWRSSVKQGRASEKLKQNEHTRIAKELTAAQWNWLTELPYFIRSDDLASLFVHAGFQANLRLTDQDPWVMMTMRSLLPGLRASARCDFRFPWASLWKGPMTVYFGHDAARGLQVYNHAVGLDTGCVYGAELTAMILPERELVAVRARRAYQDMRKSRSHKSLTATDGTRVHPPRE